MNNRTFLIIVSFYLIIVSCKKKEPQSTGYNQEGPWTVSAPLMPIDTNSVWGVMYVSRSKTQGDSSVSKYEQQEWSWFYNGTRAGYIHMDSLTFNGFPANGYCYWPYGTTQYPIYPTGLYYNTNKGANGPCTTFNIDDGVTWVAVSNNNNISIHYTFTGPFPKFTGFIPPEPSRSRGLTFTLDSSVIVGADSVVVVVFDSVSNTIKKTYSAYQGAVTMNLDAFANVGSLSIIMKPYSYSFQTISNKTYAFIKEGGAIRYATLMMQ